MINGSWKPVETISSQETTQHLLRLPLENKLSKESSFSKCLVAILTLHVLKLLQNPRKKMLQASLSWLYKVTEVDCGTHGLTETWSWLVKSLWKRTDSSKACTGDLSTLLPESQTCASIWTPKETSSNLRKNSIWSLLLLLPSCNKFLVKMSKR